MLMLLCVLLLQSASWFPASERDKLVAVARWTAALTPLLRMHCQWQTDFDTMQVKQLGVWLHGKPCSAVLNRMCCDKANPVHSYHSWGTCHITCHVASLQ